MIRTPTSSILRSTGYRHVVMVVDAFSYFLSYVPIKNMSNPLRFVGGEEVIVHRYKNNGHPVKKINDGRSIQCK